MPARKAIFQGKRKSVSFGPITVHVYDVHSIVDDSSERDNKLCPSDTHGPRKVVLKVGNKSNLTQSVQDVDVDVDAGDVVDVEIGVAGGKWTQNASEEIGVTRRSSY